MLVVENVQGILFKLVQSVKNAEVASNLALAMTIVPIVELESLLSQARIAKSVHLAIFPNQEVNVQHVQQVLRHHQDLNFVLDVSQANFLKVEAFVLSAVSMKSQRPRSKLVYPVRIIKCLMTANVKNVKLDIFPNREMLGAQNVQMGFILKKEKTASLVKKILTQLAEQSVGNANSDGELQRDHRTVNLVDGMNFIR